MKTATRLIRSAVLLTGAFFVSSTLACETSAWLGGETGSPVAGSPKAISRVSGLCAMKLTAAAAPGGSVKDTSPTAEATAFMRFYVYAQLNNGAPIIFQAFSDENATASLLTVTFDGTNFIFDAGNGASGNVGGRAGWNLVELFWSGAGMDYWVNVDSSLAATGTVSVPASPDPMESVILGVVGDLDGMITFDDYEAHRTTPVGEVLMGDADSSGEVKLPDVVNVIKEARNLGFVLTDGTPDCDLNGIVNLDDVVGVIKAARNLGAIPCGL